MSPPTDTDETQAVDTDAQPIEFDPPTEARDDGFDGRDDTDDTDDTHRTEQATQPPETTSESVRRTLDSVLPEADVDSNWWYWIAAVPLYFLVTLIGGAIGVAVFIFAAMLDIAGLGGLASLSTIGIFGVVTALFGVVGVVVAIGFPVGMYVDARALEAAGGDWTPDPVLWGLLAVVAVLVTNFVVSVPLAVYYLYKRHESVGTP